MVTRKVAEREFQGFCERHGLEGLGLSLDHQPVYGGMGIARSLADGGMDSITWGPFGEGGGRCSPGDMVRRLEFCDAILRLIDDQGVEQ